MTTTSTALDDYGRWLRRRGIGQQTIVQYIFHAGRADAGEDPFDRITDRSLSPKYRRVCRAAIISYARFRASEGDQAALALIDQIKEVKLPAPVRNTVKVPLDTTQWKNLRVEIDSADYITEAMRAELGLMAARGLRRGDILRLQKKEITDALRTDTLSFIAKGERRLEFGVSPTWKHYLESLEEEFDRERGAKMVSDLIAPGASDDNRMKAAGAAVVRGLRRVGEETGGIDVEKLTPHLLRATVATHYFVACGRDPVKLQSFMQWATLDVALGYVSAGTRESLDALAEEMLK